MKSVQHATLPFVVVVVVDGRGEGTGRRKNGFIKIISQRSDSSPSGHSFWSVT